jgi:hypothetical protein
MLVQNAEPDEVYGDSEDLETGQNLTAQPRGQCHNKRAA